MVGLSNSHQTRIASIAVVSNILSDNVMFFVPYLKDNNITPITAIVPKIRLNAAKFPPPYISATVAVP